MIRRLAGILALLLAAGALRAGTYLLLGQQTACAGRRSGSSTYRLDHGLAALATAPMQSATYLHTGGLYHLQAVAFLVGDVNADGVIDARDIEALSAYLYFHGAFPSPWRRADVNQDQRVDDQDLTRLSRQVMQPVQLRPSRPGKPKRSGVFLR